LPILQEAYIQGISEDILRPPSERVYQKYNYNIFSNTKLVDNLVAANIKTLIVTGVSTQICIETAIRNGFGLGYKNVVPSDLVGTTSNDPEAQTVTLNRVKKTFGVVTSLDKVTHIITAYAQATS
jgi:ureidoacrylate peracid hydrolase